MFKRKGSISSTNNPFKIRGGKVSSIASRAAASAPHNKSKKNWCSLRTCIRTTILLLLLIPLSLFVYFRYIHQIKSAYDLNLKPTTPKEYISYEYDFHSNYKNNIKKQTKRRLKQFPSVQQRVQTYMSNWYLPPCQTDNAFKSIPVDERLSYSYFSTTNTNANANANADKDKDKHVQEVVFSTSQDESTVLADLSTNVSHNTPFVLQPDLIQSCIDDNHHTDTTTATTATATTATDLEKKRVANKKHHLCHDAMNILKLLNDIPVRMEKDSFGVTKFFDFKASMVKEWDGSIHPIPVVIQFLTTTMTTATTTVTDQNKMYTLELYKNPIPFLQQYRSSTTTDMKNDINAVTNEKNLDCSIPGLRNHLNTVHNTGVGADTNTQSMYSPIIWFMESNIHLDMIQSIIPLDIPWSWKKNEAIVLHTSNSNSNNNQNNHKQTIFSTNNDNKNDNKNIAIQIEKDVITTDDQTKLIDESNGEEGVTNIQRMENILQSKIIIIPSTDTMDDMNELKWALYSKSVVLMPRPTITTFLMEERLEPYVHYIPLVDNYDISDVKKKLSWIKKHDKKARKVAERSTLFIHDLFFHEDSIDDAVKVQHEILRRYTKFFLNRGL